MLENTLIIVIVAMAAFFVGRRFRNSFKVNKSGGCGCGCSGCDSGITTPPTECGKPAAGFPRQRRE